MKTIKSEYEFKGIEMFSDWDFPVTLEVQPYKYAKIKVLGVTGIVVIYHWIKGFNISHRTEDLKTFIELFGDIEL